MKIATCVPKQYYTFEEKFNWLEEQIKKYGPDIFVTPQEYFGGDYIMSDKSSFTEEELLPRLLELSNKYNVGLIVGLIERENGENYERMWFIDKELKGKITKFVEPAYTLKDVGTYGLVQEDNLDNRFQVFEVKGALVSGFFCWEIYSDLLMCGLGMLDLDFCVSQIKFGISASPKKEKLPNGLIKVGGINYFKDTNWERRLQVANEFELKCPIVISTNSWNIPKKADHLFGVMNIFTKQEIKRATDEDIENGVVEISEIDLGKCRGNREHWSSYLERVGEMPPGFLRQYTMMWKVYNRERKLVKGEREKLYKYLRSQVKYKKLLNKGDELSKLVNKKK